MLYSPQDLSCYWDANRQADARTRVAFYLGLNIVTYATGRVPPQPRLTPVTGRHGKAQRHVFQAWLLRGHAGQYRSDDGSPRPRPCTT